MNVLNKGLNFEWHAPAEVKRAFLGSKPECKELLTAGTKLYKWTEFPLVGFNGITPWWFLLNDYPLESGILVPGFATVSRRAGGLTVEAREYARARAAVTLQWNTMSQRLVIRLTQPVYAFIGRAAVQRRDQNDPRIMLTGGDYQAWIPNLTVHHLVQLSPFPCVPPG